MLGCEGSVAVKGDCLYRYWELHSGVLQANIPVDLEYR